MNEQRTPADALSTPYSAEIDGKPMARLAADLAAMPDTPGTELETTLGRHEVSDRVYAVQHLLELVSGHDLVEADAALTARVEAISDQLAQLYQDLATWWEPPESPLFDPDRDPAHAR
jgi:hypothetical protein